MLCLGFAVIGIALLPPASAGGRDEAQQAWETWEDQRRFVDTTPSIKTKDGNIVLTSSEKCTMNCAVEFVKGTSMDADVTALQDTQATLQATQAALSSSLAETRAETESRNAQTRTELNAKITSLEGELKTTKDTLAAFRTKVFERCAYKTSVGGEYESAPASVNADRKCTKITNCNQHEYERVPPTPYSNRVCQRLTECVSGKTIEAKKPTPQTDRVCTTLTLCSLGFSYQVKAPTATTDNTGKVCLKPRLWRQIKSAANSG